MSQWSAKARFVAASSILLAAVSCGDAPDRPTPSVAGSSLTNASSVPSTTELRTSMPSASALPPSTRSSAADRHLPPALVGAWSGGGGKSLTFTANGRYRSNSALNEGWAAVSGDRITLTPDGREPITTTWSITGGTLYLGTSVYLRDDTSSDSLSLIGLWIEVDGYAQFRFDGNQTYSFSDPAHGRTSHGSYHVNGQTLTLQPDGRPAASFGVDYDGTYLSFVSSDGATTGRYVRAG